MQTMTSLKVDKSISLCRKSKSSGRIAIISYCFAQSRNMTVGNSAINPSASNFYKTDVGMSFFSLISQDERNGGVGSLG